MYYAKGKNIFTKALIIILMLIALTLTACSNSGDNEQLTNNKTKETIVLADAGWDSMRLHNDIAKLIIENGYGYKTDVMMGSTPVTFTALKDGDIDVYMEAWTQNIGDAYYDSVKKGDVLELSLNFKGKQGLYVPTFIVKGDTEKGIKPLAPELKTVKDLPKYWEIFRDPEAPEKGRIYGAIPGWVVDNHLYEKYQTYGLDKTYNYFRPGSDAALGTAITDAMKNQKPWIGYYWEPTWILGKYDLTLLEDEAYTDEKWNNGRACAFPDTEVTVAVNKELPSKAPDVVEFLKNYKTSTDITNSALAYMQDNNADTEEAAKWFIEEYEETWSKWVPDDIAKKVKDSI